MSDIQNNLNQNNTYSSTSSPNAMQSEETVWIEKVHLDSEEPLEDIYGKLSNYEDRIHEDNQKRIKAGIRCLWFVPLVFMFLMFLTDSSKLIFLVLWIASLFMIAIYLVYVEYSDHKLQEQMNEIRGIEEEDRRSNLIDVDSRRAYAEELLNEKHANTRATVETLLGREQASTSEEGGEES